MSLKLPAPSASYSQQDQAQMRSMIERADARNVKIGDNLDVASAKLILTASDGSRHQVVVAADGTLSTAPA